MSVFLKKSDLKVKNPTTGTYQGQSLFTENDTQTQLNRINSAGTTQVNAVNAKGQETLASIPDDYTELSNDVDDLKSDLSELNCGNLLNDLTHFNQTNKGITWAWNGNKCTISGTSTAIANNDMYASQSELPSGFEAGKTYHVYYSSGNVNLRIYVYPNEGTLTEILSTKIDADFTLPINTVGLIIRLNIPSGVAVNETICPVISDDYSNQKIQRTLNDLQKSLVLTQNGASYLLGYSDFVNGTLSYGNLNRTVLYRVSSESIIKFNHNITLTVASGFRFAVQTFSDGTYTNDSGWKTTEYTIPANTQFKIIIARVQEDATEVADIALFETQVKFKSYTQQLIDEIPYLSETTTFYKAVSNIALTHFSQGSIGGTGDDETFAHNARARSPYLFAVNDIVITADIATYPSAKTIIFYFDYDKIFVSSTGWQSAQMIPKGSIFRVLLSRVYNSTDAVSVEDNYNSFVFNPNYLTNTNRLCKSVSHQGNVNTTDNYCKAEGYIRAGLAGFDYAECDVKFTADDIPVCSHDGSFIDATTGNSVRIESYTLEQLQAFDYYSGTIASLDEVISICKQYGMGLYLDQMNPNWSDARYDALLQTVNKHRFAKNCKYIIYNSDCIEKILSRDKTAWLVCGQPHGTETADPAITLANSAVTDYNKIDVMLNDALGLSAIENAVKTMDSRFGLNIYTLDTIALKVEFSQVATSITTNSDSFIYF